MKKVRLYGTTSALGALTVVGSKAIEGYIRKVRWIDGTFADGVDAVISVTNSDGDETILTLTDANNDASYYPRVLVHTEAGAALTGTDGGDRQAPYVIGTPKLVVSAGGEAASGGCVIIYE